MKIGTAFVVIAILASEIAPALGFSPNGWEQQRGQYPTDWNNTADKSPIFQCSSPQAGVFRIKIGTPDGAGRSMMSLVPVSRRGGVEEKEGVLRIWLDAEQTRRLRAGKYFATILRQKNSCWVRGDLDDGKVVLMDNSKAPPDDVRKVGSFYNKAPRFSVYEGNAYYCVRMNRCLFAQSHEGRSAVY